MASSDDDFTHFIGSRLPALRRTAYMLCGDLDRGDDVVQRTITELYLKWDRARRADNLDAFVRTVLVRRFIDSQRGGWSRVRLSDWLPDRPDVELDHATRLDVIAALRRVAPRQRAVLVLRYLHGLSVEQSAETLGCSTGTVKSQASRGLATMRELLGPTFASRGTNHHA